MNDQGKPIATIKSDELRSRIHAREKIVIIDVRSKEEFSAGHVEGAINIPADELPAHISGYSRAAMIVTVCNLGGARSFHAAEKLHTLGYEKFVPLQGGMRKWQEESAEN